MVLKFPTTSGQEKILNFLQSLGCSLKARILNELDNFKFSLCQRKLAWYNLKYNSCIWSLYLTLGWPWHVLSPNYVRRFPGHRKQDAMHFSFWSRVQSHIGEIEM